MRRNVFDKSVLAAAGAALIFATASTGAAAQDSEFGVLPMGKGVEETYYMCAACHSEKLVVQQGLTREGWDELITWMVDEQEMEEPDPEERKIVLDYLSTHFNTDRPNFPARK